MRVSSRGFMVCVSDVCWEGSVIVGVRRMLRGGKDVGAELEDSSLVNW